MLVYASCWEILGFCQDWRKAIYADILLKIIYGLRDYPKGDTSYTS